MSTKKKTTSSIPATQMNAALQKKCDEIRDATSSADTRDVGLRYKIGVHVLEVMSAEGTYGSSAVEVIASAIGRTAALLYGYAGIARAWPNAAKFDEIAKESTARKTRLTATHFAVLAGVTDDATREALRKTCLESTYSVRALKEHIANSAPKKENSNNVRSLNEHRAVGRLVSVSTSLVRRVEDGLAPLAEGAAAMSPISSSSCSRTSHASARWRRRRRPRSTSGWLR